VTLRDEYDWDVVASLSADADMHRLWFTMLRYSWESLAIVPTEARIETHQLMETLVELGRQHGAKPIRSLNAIGVRLGDVQGVTESIRQMTEHGVSVVVSVDPLADNPAALPIACAVSGVLLVVRMGESLLTRAAESVAALGRERLIGSVVLG